MELEDVNTNKDAADLLSIMAYQYACVYEHFKDKNLISDDLKDFDKNLDNFDAFVNKMLEKYDK